jgi:predicted RNA-binding Zn-ribbon protein involved in translation (DUF1610 family)
MLGGPRWSVAQSVFDGQTMWQVNQWRSAGVTKTEWFATGHLGDGKPFEARERLLADFPHHELSGARGVPYPLFATQMDARGHPRKRYVYAVGWPFRALWCEDDRAGGAGGAWAGALSLQSPDRMPTLTRLKALPLRPLWPGLLANTAVFSLGWGLLLIGLAALQHRRRWKQHQCTACGYDLRGLQGRCPECGTPMALRTASQCTISPVSRRGAD